MPAYWLLKTEPGDYSFADLEGDGTTTWDGVRNSAALKHMRAMQAGDRALVYHTGKERQVVGLAEIVAVTPSTPVTVEVRALRRLVQAVPLATFKADPFFADFALVRQSRLSVMPVNDEQWEYILRMAREL